MAKSRYWRYFGSHLYETLCEKELLMSRVSTLNDPFEFAYLPTPTLSQRAAEQSFKKSMRDPAFLNYAKSAIPTISRRALNRLSSREKEKLTDLLKEHNSQYDPAGSGDATEVADKAIRLCCFTLGEVTLDNEILMWSHYANKHQGFRVEFELEEHILQKVEYSKRRVPLTLHKQPPLKDIKSSICTKAKGWEYENEFRLIVGVDACRHSPDGKLSFFGFAATEITGIDFGINCPQGEVIKVSAEVAKNYPHVILRKAERCLKQYHINYVSC